MGAVLIVIGLISLATSSGANMMSLMMGGIFAVVGLAMIGSSRFKKSAPIEELPLKPEGLPRHGA